mgnify:CR=1 FL=1
MKRFALMLVLTSLALVIAAPLAAQTVTPDVSQPPSISVSDQLSLDGVVTVASVFSPQPGWIAIHADNNGAPGAVVGIMNVLGGLNENVPVGIDVLGATPTLWVMLHVDDGTIGEYEFDGQSGFDNPVSADGQVVMQSFNVTAIRVFDQRLTNDTAAVASTISAQGGWMVIHADNNGAPGAVIGAWLLQPGTSPATRVLLDPAGVTPILWAMLHVDDGTLGVYEFDGQSGLDAPVSVNGQVATASFNATAQDVVVTTANTPLDNPSNALPFISAFNQDAQGDGVMSTFVVNSVLSVGPGWTEVHADNGGQPGKSLGSTPVPDGESANVQIQLNAAADITAPPTTLPAVVWPMLHTDDGEIGVYEYLRHPGIDLPVVVNGAIVTYPVSIVPPDPLPTLTPEATVEATPEATPDATDEPEETAEATDVPTAEVTDVLETPEATEPPVDVTVTVEPPVDVTPPVEPPIDVTVEVTVEA